MQVQVKAEGLVEAIAFYNGVRGRWANRVKTTATEYGEFAKTYMQKRYRTGGTTDTRTAVRTGRLRRAYDFAVRGNAQGVDLHLGVVRPGANDKALKYAAIQEYGGTIRAKAGRALAIPIGRALTARGVARGGPRDFSNTFVLYRRGRNPLIMWQRTKTKVDPIFVLKRSVKIPARPALAPTVTMMRPKFEQAVVEDLRRAISG